jgi:flagellar biosynthesis/type III secretory pathway chaperone
MVNQLDDLDHSLERKLKAYDEFLEATLLLQKALENEEMAAVTQLLTRREELIKDIDGLDRRINRYRQEGLFARSSAITRLTGKLPDEIRQTLKQIRSANQACDTIAASRCEATRKELMILRQTEVGLQGYAHKTERIPKFLNLHT